MESKRGKTLGRRVGRGNRAERVMSTTGQEHSGGVNQRSATTSSSAGDDSCIQSAILRTWPWLTEASAQFLAGQLAAGSFRELEEQIRISEQGRGQNQNSPLSNVLVTVTSHSAFLINLVDTFLQLLVEVQVRAHIIAPVSTGDRQTVTIDSVKIPQSSGASSASTIGSSSRKTCTSTNIPVSPPLEREMQHQNVGVVSRAQDAGYFSELILCILFLQRRRSDNAGPVRKLAFDGKDLERFNVGAVEYVGDPADGDGWVVSCCVPDGLSQADIERVKVTQDDDNVLHVWFGAPPANCSDGAAMEGQENVQHNKQVMRQVRFQFALFAPSHRSLVAVLKKDSFKCIRNTMYLKYTLSFVRVS